MDMTRAIRLACAAAAVGASLLGGTAQATTCVRTPGNPYHEVCVGRGDCLVYVWSTMPPAICA